VDQVKVDYRKANLDPRTRAIMDFAILITDDPHAVTPATVEDLRSKGLSDEDVLNVVQITGYFNYYNLMADALGVEPEDFMPPDRSNHCR
jgi:uncharacterized peroxidase-related enzyme